MLFNGDIVLDANLIQAGPVVYDFLRLSRGQNYFSSVIFVYGMGTCSRMLCREVADCVMVS